MSKPTAGEVLTAVLNRLGKAAAKAKRKKRKH